MMKWYSNLKISVKLILGFVLVALIAAVVGMVAINDIKDMEQRSTVLYEKHTSTMDDLAVIMANYQQERAVLWDFMLLEDKQKLEEKSKLMAQLDQEMDESMAIFEEGIVGEEVREHFANLTTVMANFREYRDSLIETALKGQVEEAIANTYAGGVEINEAVITSVNAMMDLKVQQAKENADSNTQAAEKSIITMLTIIVAGVLIAIILGILIAGIISRGINELAKAADKMADGDVNVSININTKDELGKLAHSFGKMISNIQNQAAVAEKIASGDLTVDVKVRSEVDLLNRKLQELVVKNNEVLHNISSASEQVAAGARQVSDSSIALSQGATEQASSIEQLTASLEEISSQTRLNAQNADQASELAEVAKKNAQKGNSQMKEMQKAMEEINESSTNISKIIKVIDEIAFQTNMLALNAAVEAARAGQHGKGFAVVAEEVRNLAARSANAAKETTEMISGSISKIDAGTKIADETAEALNKIVEDVAKAADLVGHIAVASNEQAGGIAQINQGIMQVSQVVQTNSATSEESAAASEELSSQAELLKTSVSKYKLKANRYSLNRFEELNPEVLKMLENMSQGSKNTDYKNKEETFVKEKIVLSDSEFDKY